MLLLFQMPVKLAIDIGEEFKLKPGGGGIKSAAGYGSLGELISNVLPNVYIIASLILFLLLIAGGFAIITSSGNPEKQKQGSKALTAAIIGFALVFASFWIIKLIEFLTGIPIFKSGV